MCCQTVTMTDVWWDRGELEAHVVVSCGLDLLTTAPGWGEQARRQLEGLYDLDAVFAETIVAVAGPEPGWRLRVEEDQLPGIVDQHRRG